LIDALIDLCYDNPGAAQEYPLTSPHKPMPKATYNLTSDIGFEAAARAMLRAGFAKMRDNVAGTRDGLDKSVATPEEIESLHDMRVGSRRLRAAVSVFGGIFGRRDFADLDKEIASITDALGAVRDLDVQLDSLRALQASLPLNEAYGIGRLIARQTKRRDRERKALLTVLDDMKKDRFARRFKRLLDDALPPTKAKGA
jgi:CHAD domain-containing protein